MSSITTDTNINQNYIDTNTGPYTISSSATVTFTDDLVLNLSNNKYFIFGGEGTIDGGGFRVTLENAAGTFAQGNNASTHTIQNVGVISGTGHSLPSDNSGGVYTPLIGNMTQKIKNCYYIGDITNFGGGIYGSNSISSAFQTNTTYIQDCYVIGDVTGTDAGGIAGLVFGRASTSLIVNSYVIGNVTGTDAGAITGRAPGTTFGQVYVYNCYHSSGNTFGTESSADTYVASKKTYDYNGSWSDSAAGTAGLSTSVIATSDMTNSTDWTAWGTPGGSFGLTSGNLTSAGISDGQSTMFSFSSNTPYGVSSFRVSPFQPEYYTTATSEATNCFCAGTKITLKDGSKVNIELVRQGDEVMTPHGVTKKVLHVGKMWFNGNSQKHYPYLIPKDYFEEGKPCEDTYVSGAHSLLFSKAQGELLGLPDGRTKERGNGLDLFLVKSFAEKTEYQKVCVLKGEKYPYGFYYYHLVIEDNYGFMANGIPSESLEMKDFMENFEEINQNRIEEIN